MPLAVARRAASGTVRAHHLGPLLQLRAQRQVLLVHQPRPLAPLRVEKVFYVGVRLADHLGSRDRSLDLARVGTRPHEPALADPLDMNCAHRRLLLGDPPSSARRRKNEQPHAQSPGNCAESHKSHAAGMEPHPSGFSAVSRSMVCTLIARLKLNGAMSGRKYSSSLVTE